MVTPMTLNSHGQPAPNNRAGSHPRVTIGMPVFNGEKFMPQALDSALGQTFEDLEIVISDNASMDGTEQVCRSYAERDSRIRYYRSDVNRGAAWNHNRVFELARGEYFKWWSHDDFCAPEFLEKCVSVLDSDPGVVLCTSRTQIVDADGNPMTQYKVPAMTRMDSPRAYPRFHGAICPNHWCFEVYGLGRTAVLRQTPLIANYAGSDRALLGNLALRGRFYEIPSVGLFNREHPSRSIRTYSPYTAGAWYDPRLAGKISLLNWRRLLEHARSVSRSGLGWWERVCCYAQLLPFCVRWRRGLVRDLVVAAKTIRLRVSPRGDPASQVAHGDKSERQV